MFNIYKNIFIWTRSITITYGALDSGPFGQAVDLFVFNLSRKERHNCYQWNVYIFATLCESYVLDSSDLNFFSFIWPHWQLWPCPCSTTMYDRYVRFAYEPWHTLIPSMTTKGYQMNHWPIRATVLVLSAI